LPVHDLGGCPRCQTSASSESGYRFRKVTDHFLSLSQTLE